MRKIINFVGGDSFKGIGVSKTSKHGVLKRRGMQQANRAGMRENGVNDAG